MNNLEKFLNEANKANTKKLGQNLDVTLANVISKTIEDWIKQNINPVTGWDHPTQRYEVLLYAAEGAIQFFNGMVRASKQGIKRGK